MATFSALGIGSGLDAESLVTQLMSLERRPITQLTTKETGVKAKISAYGTIKSALDSLKTAADVLGDANKLSAFKATPADATIATATATGSASAGTYSLNVIRLATAHKLTSDTNFSSGSAAVGAGTFAITVGTTTTNVALSSPTATLNDLRDAINASSAGVTAAVVTGDAGTKLVLSAKESGQTVSVTATDDNAGDGADFTQLSGFSTVGAAPQTAQVEIDGVLVTSNSNTITSALNGVSLTLAKAGTTTLSVARDSSTVTTAAENFVKAYNDLQTQIANQTKYDASSKTASTLTGDGALRNIQSQIYAAISEVPAGLTGTFSRLHELGISLQSGGKLALDSSKLQTAIGKDFASVVSVLNGYGNAVETKAGQLTASDGILTGRTDSLNASLKDISDRKASLELRMEAIEKRYRSQFTALDTLVAGMKTTSTFLTQQLANLS